MSPSGGEGSEASLGQAAASTTAPEVRPPASSVDEVLALFAEWGEEPYDEELSQSSHAAQAAAWARQEGAEDVLVAAALLHDVGHLLVMEATGATGPDDEVDLHHEALGARYLAALFPPSVTGPIALHVQAKRYRCAVDPAQLDALSAGSRASLARQGGPMDAAEVARFERLAASEAALRLRAWDDAGKSLDERPLPVADHRELLLRVARVTT